MTRRLTGADGPHADAELVVGGAPAAAARVAVVLVHGRGGTPDGVVRLADEFYRSGVTLLAPGAHHGNWFPAGHDAPVEANEPALTSAVDCVGGAVEAAREVAIPPERIALVGVSQGASVACEFLLRHPRRFGGAFAISGALPGEDITARSVEGDLDGTPVVLDCSDTDPYVPLDRVEATASVLRRGGAAVEVHVDEGSGHGLSDAGAERIRARLDALLEE